MIDPVAVAQLVTNVLSEMPDPLIPSFHYESFAKALQLNLKTKKSVLAILVGKLPTENWTLLKLLVDFLRRYTAPPDARAAAPRCAPGDIEALSSRLSQHILRPGQRADAPRGDSAQVRRLLVELVGESEVLFRHNLSRSRAADVESRGMSTAAVDRAIRQWMTFAIFEEWSMGTAEGGYLWYCLMCSACFACVVF